LNNPCVAHRGASGLAPENTMAAIRKALSFPFVRWIEIDVQLSRDGVPVVIHDDSLRRTARKRRKVAALEAARLKQFDAGRWFGPAFAGEPIPLLEEVLEAVAGRASLNIELKTYGGRYPGMERKVVELLRRWDMQQSAVITSFDAFALRRVRSITTEIKTGLITDTVPPTLVSDMQWLGAEFLSISHTQLNAERMAAFNAAGLQVMAWTVNDVAKIKQLAAIDPAIMICTNYPDRWSAALLQERDIY
jgi:glycerophosphoryl diester phosphodiesterase